MCWRRSVWLFPTAASGRRRKNRCKHTSYYFLQFRTVREIIAIFRSPERTLLSRRKGDYKTIISRTLLSGKWFRRQNLESPELTSNDQQHAPRPANPPALALAPPTHAPARLAGAETAFIFLLFAVFAGGPPPDVNEAHYLLKARHFWQPATLPGDLFLESADVHVLFEMAIGWLTLFFPLAAVAWIGRIVTWLLLAIGWRRLSWALMPRAGAAVVFALLWLALLHRCHLAGEWVVGGVEAKSVAFSFVFLGLASLVQGRWNGAWIWFGVASAFHVLAGGWSVVAAGVVWLLSSDERPTLRSMAPSLALGGVLSLGGLLPALATDAGVSSDVSTAAHEIYTYGRLSHHLVFHRFSIVRIALFGQMLLAGVLMFGLLRGATDLPPSHKRLFRFVFGGLLLGAAGVAIDAATRTSPAWGGSLLRLYWFRLADVATPLGTALAFILLMIKLSERRKLLAAGLTVLAISLAGFEVGDDVVRRLYDGRPGADRQTLPVVAGNADATRAIYQDWLRVCRWIKQETPPDAGFLTPRLQQTFKWNANRREAICWKDVPQDSRGLVEWWRRFEEIHASQTLADGATAHSDARLRELAGEYGFQYILVDRARAVRELGFPKVYPTAQQPNGSYDVYRIDL